MYESSAALSRFVDDLNAAPPAFCERVRVT